MKKITAIVREDRFTMVKDALSDVGYPGMTVTGVKGHGNQKGITEQWRGRTYTTDLISKMQMEKTGNIGDGKIFINPILDVIRIRTGERGEKAV